MLALLDPRLWLALLIALAGAYGTGRLQQRHSDDNAQAASLLKATVAARQTEANWQQDAATIEEVHAHELRDIAAQRDAALAGLRDHRAPRLPEAARSACHGATGAELSSRDASDLVGLAARADIVRADLAACQAWIGKVKSQD